jgi:NADH-quinone oxidoreductase subunit D
MSTTSDPTVGAGDVGAEGDGSGLTDAERDELEASQRRPDGADVTVMEPFATAEGRQEMRSRAEISATELLRQSGAVLRIGEAEAERLAEETASSDDETMIINMGPQHPSTHGVLRVMLELRGETVLRTKPVIGYLHTGMEKTAEELTFLQGTTNTTRMDYLSNMHNELVFSLATETLLGITDDMPPRATWIRMFMCELQRIASHLLFFATNGMDMASTTSMIFGIRERDAILRFFEQASGLRMNYNYIRVGGVAADLPDGWEDTVTRLLDELERKLVEHDDLFSGQPIWHGRSQGVGVIGPEEAVALGATGPILRAAGVPWDLRRDEPHLAYDQVDFDVIVGTHGDTFDRYAVRMNEIRESIRIVRQCIARMPAGTGASRTARSRRRPAPASTSRWRRSSTTSRSSPRGSASRGRGLRRRGVRPGRARLLPRLRRQRKALPHAHPGPELREHPDAPAPHARGPRGRTPWPSSPPSTPVMGEVDR